MVPQDSPLDNGRDEIDRGFAKAVTAAVVFERLEAKKMGQGPSVEHPMAAGVATTKMLNGTAAGKVDLYFKLSELDVEEEDEEDEINTDRRDDQRPGHRMVCDDNTEVEDLSLLSVDSSEEDNPDVQDQDKETLIRKVRNHGHVTCVTCYSTACSMSRRMLTTRTATGSPTTIINTTSLSCPSRFRSSCHFSWLALAWWQLAWSWTLFSTGTSSRPCQSCLFSCLRC